MKKLVSIFSLFLLALVTSGCCFSVGSIVIGKDCNKKMYCNANAVEMEYSFNLPTSYSDAYQKSVKSVVTILAESNSNKISSSSGSGVVIKEDATYAYIATNRHVVATKTSNYSIFHSSIDVIFSDYARAKAELVGSASSIDVAIIKVAKSNIEAIYSLPTMKNSFSEIAIGDNIFAIGSPLGTDHAFSASFGSISNLYNTKVDFTSSGLGYYYPIQIDAAVNPGNSGGGLFNANGDLIGLIQGGRTTGTEGDTTISTTGINYAIPITTVLNVADNLITKGSYNKAIIGIETNYLFDLKTMSQSDRIALNIPTDDKTGIFVRHIVSNGPAYEAGMSSHFIVETIDNIKIDSLGKWEMYLGSKNEGDIISVVGHYVNNPSTVTYQITLD